MDCYRGNMPVSAPSLARRDFQYDLLKFMLKPKRKLSLRARRSSRHRKVRISNRTIFTAKSQEALSLDGLTCYRGQVDEEMLRHLGKASGPGPFL